MWWTVFFIRRWSKISLFDFGYGKRSSEKQKCFSDDGGFAFEVQLSITEKGQYAVAYGLSCKKDCHELHTTDPRRTIPYPIPVSPLYRHRNRQTAQPPQKHHQPRNQAALHPRAAIQRRYVRSRRFCHSFAEVLTLFKISTVSNKLQFGMNTKRRKRRFCFYQLQITNSPLVLPVLSLPTV